MKDIDWSKAPEGATHYDPNYPDEPWTKLDPKGGWHAFIKGKWQGPHPSDDVWIQEEKWEHLILRPEPTPWQGPQDGLPPVGTECEYYKNDEWRKGVIFGHRKHRNGAVDVFIDFGLEWDYTSDLPRFRPVQSELDKILNYAHNLVDKKLISSNASADGSFSLESIIEVLYDAGMLVDPERKSMSRADAYNRLGAHFRSQDKNSYNFIKGFREGILDALGYKE